ncbi:hypothetical protein NDU88_006010 [Pleurodeles waltl]|uniref:Uncharacterized protein n=1 Tax=Pleurodeles waltl TaxID=8319 RepID=A0AAV7LYY2_PLEWA|nr:hypothetical protein NDU88_006010 [Pleurodeles waltl]
MSRLLIFSLRGGKFLMGSRMEEWNLKRGQCHNTIISVLSSFNLSLHSDIHLITACRHGDCDGPDYADPHISTTCADSAHGVPDTPRRAGLPIGSPQCPQEGGAVIRTAGIMPGCLFQRKRTEEPTGERTIEVGEEHEGAVAGEFRRHWKEEDDSEDPIPLRSRHLEEDCWARGAHA